MQRKWHRVVADIRDDDPSV